MEKGEKLTLSGLQHFAFCRRQWALIFIDILAATHRQLRRYLGELDRAQYSRTTVNRRLSALRSFFRWLNVTDVCDVVEFHESADGVALYGQEGRWTLSAQREGKTKWIMSRT